MTSTRQQLIAKRKAVAGRIFVKRGPETVRALIRQNIYLTRVVSAMMTLVEAGFCVWSISKLGVILFSKELTFPVIAQWLYLVITVYSGVMYLYLHCKDSILKKAIWKQKAIMGMYYSGLLVFGIILSALYKGEGKNAYVLVLSLICTFGVAMMSPIRILIASFVTYVVYIAVYIGLDCLVVEHALNVLEILFFLNIIALVKYYTFCEYLSSTLKLREYTKLLEELSFTDELTGIGNRNALRRDFESYVGRTYCVCLVDVDDFKEYNDRYGHPIGDMVLHSVASCLKQEFGQDRTYRMGGDEFIVITEMNEVETKLRLDNVLRKVKDIRHGESELGVGLSIGFVKGKCRIEEDMHDYMEAADEVLYEVKEKGKNNYAYRDMTK